MDVTRRALFALVVCLLHGAEVDSCGKIRQRKPKESLCPLLSLKSECSKDDNIKTVSAIKPFSQRWPPYGSILCSCDYLCHWFGDCCFGVPKISPTSGVRDSGMFEPANWKRLSCINPMSLLSEFYGDPKGYVTLGVYMMRSCPETWPGDGESLTVKEMCENFQRTTNVSDALLVTPVTTSDLTYANVFCAICNNRSKDEYVYWVPRIKCDRDIFRKTRTYNATVKFCEIIALLSPKITKRFFDPIRRCTNVSQQVEINTCLPFNQLHQKDGYSNLSKAGYDSLVSRCQSYKSYYYTEMNSTPQYFRNVDCVRCNGIKDPKCFGFDKGDCIGVSPLSALLDFGNNGRISLTWGRKYELREPCAEGEVFISWKGECQSVVSLQANSRLSERDQVVLILNFSLYSNSTFERFLLITSSYEIDIFRDYLKSVLNQLTEISTVQTVNISVNGNVLDIALEVLCVNFTINSTVAWTEEYPLQFYYDDILFQTSKFRFEVSSVKNDTNCTTAISLNSSQYSLIGDSLLLTDTKRLLQPSDYFVANSILYICNESQYGRWIKAVDIRWTYNKLAVVLSVVGSGILIIACLSILLIYSFFKDLRNLPGKCIMSYAFSVAASHLLVIFGPGQTEQRDTCIAMGVFLHYFILCQFTWSSLIATDLFRTFVLTSGSITGYPRSQTFLWYNVIAWGVPLAVCTTAVILDQKSNIDINYASDRICWLQPGMASLIAFGVPVASILAYNLFVFVLLTVSMYRKLKAHARTLSEMNIERQKFDHIRVQMKVFLGTFSLLGLAWIFGFIASASDQDWMWYVFLIANVAQGIFLFTVFVVSGKVRLLCGRYVVDNSVASRPRPRPLTRLMQFS